MIGYIKKFWNFLKEDSWPSLIVSLIITFLVIKFVLFPVMSLAFGTRLPLVVVESCSMYHEQGFDGWWEQNGLWYEEEGISREDFAQFGFKNGMNKGDIVLVSGRGEYGIGDVIIFSAGHTYPLIHRIVDVDELSTKGDHNGGQLEQEKGIEEEAVIGRAIARVPGLGWIKLIFFEGMKPSESRGFCR